jgi:signal transduction histidine kinase
VVAERVDFWAALAEDQGRAVALALPSGPSPVRAGSTDLEAALDALLGNVLSHTPDGTGLAVSLAPGPAGSWLLEIDDEGPGFADSAVLDRGDSRAGSTGLGLDIARRTAVASGGDLTIGRESRRRRAGHDAARSADQRAVTTVVRHLTAAAGRSRRTGTAASGR